MSGRVLVVDDEPHILRALKASLRGAGYEVDTADTAEGALTAAALAPPDAVILDLVLPDGRGTDVARELRTWSSVPIMARCFTMRTLKLLTCESRSTVTLTGSISGC